MDEEHCVAIIQVLLVELASELDLHYDPVDYHRLGPTVVHLANGAVFLEINGYEVPPEVKRLISRFREYQN